jgi:DNA-binding beta-propeller fold protein YncE
VCAIGVSGSLSGCTPTGSGFVGLDGISLSGGYAYVANENGGSVSVCSIDANGGLSSCATYSGVGVAPSDIVISGNQAYVNDASSGNVYLCSVAAATGALANCVIANAGNSFSAGIQIAIH